MGTTTFIEGSIAVAKTIGVCRPQVISAYPITPQTHIVEHLSELVAEGELKTEYVNVESEHSAASVVLGASATGARAYTATTSQGFLLMIEVLFNIAGMRLPIIMTCVNRAVSAPINIWNDQQDSLTARDSGWIQLYAEDNQEASDMHLQAFKIAENKDIMLPVMVCMDGFVLTHSFEPIELISQEDADKFLPPYKPQYYLNPKNPLSFGTMVGPDGYMETRYFLEKTMRDSQQVISDVAAEFHNQFGRFHGGLIDTYKVEDATHVFVAMGSVIGTLKDIVDEQRAKGQKIGVLKIRSYRPFPKDEIYKALNHVREIIVLEKAISLGYGGILANEIKSVFYGKPKTPKINGYIIGLGGRDITIDTIHHVIKDAVNTSFEEKFIGLNEALIK
ncbi:MAG: pyruvate ferredoxin oxidoreductase [wastewater metagenome]|nr:pyruvate ferredoxin oxidoreductase [Candidatus Loosdrechtia aerotolerans]